MIREWPGQTKEEWLKEYERHQRLSPDEQKKEADEFMERLRRENKTAKQTKEILTQTKKSNPYDNYDHPNSLENDEATLAWIVVMIISAFFKGNWIIWIVATIIWRKYITRHKRKK